MVALRRPDQLPARLKEIRRQMEQLAEADRTNPLRFDGPITHLVRRITRLVRRWSIGMQ